tara:strand:+ start:1150 stop:1404 length:255 start_codon:yes stop_codon:yes gene_type:complete
MTKPTNELKSTPFTEVLELERIVTPDEEKRVDHVFVRRIKICKRHPEGFPTEEYARFDIAWPEEVKEEIKDSNVEKEDIKITSK